MTLNQLIDMGWVEISAYVPVDGGVNNTGLKSKAVFHLARKANDINHFHDLVSEAVGGVPNRIPLSEMHLGLAEMDLGGASDE